MDKQIKKRARARSLKVMAGEEFTTIVINAAAYLTIHANQISSSEGQPSLKSMRAPLVPAYEIIAQYLGKLLNVKFSADDLTGLAVNMNPGLGVWSFSVTHKQAIDLIQSYNVNVMAQDGLNTFRRLCNKVGVDTAQAIYSHI